MNEYGNVLGRLICMYLRMLDQEEEFGVVDHDLTASQRQKIQDLKDVLIEGSAEDGEMDARFHTVLTELFLVEGISQAAGGFGLSSLAIGQRNLRANAKNN